MENNEQHLAALTEIREMMKKSNKFLSLSGFSGVFAGIYALIGAYLAKELLSNYSLAVMSGQSNEGDYEHMIFLGTAICAAVLGLSLITALFFSSRKAKKTGQKFFDHTAIRLMINMLIPLLAGGLFCIAMLFHGGSMILLITPAMLIFYGLALVNGSQYTLHDIRYLGFLQIALGIFAGFYLGYGLLFWALGFGVLHIVYGAFMWFKYDRKN